MNLFFHDIFSAKIFSEPSFPYAELSQRNVESPQKKDCLGEQIQSPDCFL